MHLKRVLIISNPKAGRNFGGSLVDKLSEGFKKYGCTVSNFITEYKNDICEAVTQIYEQRIELLVIVGGDGTINEVVNHIMDDLNFCLAKGQNREVPLLAFFPGGTANLVALELGMTSDTDFFTMCCCNENCRTEIWPARVGNKYFIAVAGVGFDAYIISKVSYAVKRRFAKMAYALQTFKFLSRPWKYFYRIKVDGVDYRAVSAIIANSKYYAGPYVVKEEAAINKQNFFVCLFEKPERRYFLLYAVYLLCGKLEKCRGVKIIKGKEIQITGVGQKGVQIDGDLMMELPILVKQGNISLKVVGKNV